MKPSKRYPIALLVLVLSAALAQLPAAAQSQPARLYLPAVLVSVPPPIFGVETALSAIAGSRVQAQARSLGATWLRLNGILWSAVEPARGAPYNWAALAGFDRALASAKAIGLTPVPIVRGTPLWAAATESGCAAIRDEYFADYARFMAALVERYRDDVRYWELGNEPDVDSTLLPTDSPYGCWGTIGDPYYGGERYGRMLTVVAPAMRAASPIVQIVSGGLLLDRPETTNPFFGRPELFLEGVLRAGAANSFDILAYHAYPVYMAENFDHDLYAGDVWPAVGGWTLGKANYLRAIMASYGVHKPLWLNETGLICGEWIVPCDPPNSAFFEAQAEHVVRIMARAAAAQDITQVSWYTLDGPGWRSTGLLDGDQNPRPAFDSYRRMIAAVGQYTAVRRVSDYGEDIEAYRFVRRSSVVDVVWSRSGDTTWANVPLGAYRSAMARDGSAPQLSLSSTQVSVAVGFSAVFIERTP